MKVHEVRLAIDAEDISCAPQTARDPSTSVGMTEGAAVAGSPPGLAQSYALFEMWQR